MIATGCSKAVSKAVSISIARWLGLGLALGLRPLFGFGFGWLALALALGFGKSLAFCGRESKLISELASECLTINAFLPIA